MAWHGMTKMVVCFFWWIDHQSKNGESPFLMGKSQFLMSKSTINGVFQ
jgi:hypothetical protein